MDANIQKYQAFVEVADAGSFTKAAETLAYSQSGISHMVSDLERDWGVALFERSRRGVVLTGDGARLLPEARALCESFRALEATVDEVRGLETGLIRIGVFPSVAAHWIPRIIKRFNADYPGIDYKLRVSDYTEIEEWIAAGTVDCGFVMLPLRTDARLVVRALEEDEFLAVLPRDHELASAEVFPVERLAELDVIAAVQPPHMTLDPGGPERDLGDERVKLMWPFRTMLDEGETIAFGTDSPVVDVNSMGVLYSAATRRDPQTRTPEGGWRPEQLISRAEAIRAYTAGSDAAAQRNGEAGVLAAGKLADMAVLDTDLLTCSDDEILDAHVTATWMGGRCVFEA